MTKSGFKIVQLSKDWYATTRAAKMETGETVSKGKQKGGISSKLRRGKGTLVKSNTGGDTDQWQVAKYMLCTDTQIWYYIYIIYNIFKNNENLLKSAYGVDVPIPNHLATWDRHGDPLICSQSMVMPAGHLVGLGVLLSLLEDGNPNVTD